MPAPTFLECSLSVTESEIGVIDLANSDFSGSVGPPVNLSGLAGPSNSSLPSD